MAIRLTPTSDDVLWQRLVDESPLRTAFHDWSLLVLLGEVFGWRFDPLVVLADDVPVGVIPVFRQQRWSPRSADPPFPFLGPLVPDPHLVGALQALRRWQAQHGLLMVRFDFAPQAGAPVKAALEAAQCEWANDATFIVDLRHGSRDILRARMESEVRRRLRRAGDNGVEIRQSLPGELAGLLPRVLDESYTSHGKPSPYPDALGERLERWAAGRSDVYTGTALVNGEPAGVLVVLGGTPVAMSWLGGCLREFRRANPNIVLNVDSFDWALDRGHDGVDFGGYVDDEVARFKSSFGAERHTYLSAASLRIPRFVVQGAQAARQRQGRPPLPWAGGDAAVLH